MTMSLFEKYKRLISNTVILGAGTFASKVLVFLLMPFYTSILSTAEFGTADLVAQTANLLIPLAAVGICDGIFRFTLDVSDDAADRKRVFSTGVAILSAGSLFLLGAIWVLRFFEPISDYVLLIAFYVIAANFHSAFANYLRAEGKTVLFAVQGMINTVLTIALNVLFLLTFRMGATGYVLSVVVADFSLTLILFFLARLWRDFSVRSISKETAKELLKFSIPYIPTTMLWLITSVSDRYIVTYFCGESENGLYAAAYKLPTLLSLVSGVFVEAWHFSTVRDAGDDEKGDFFGTFYLHFMSVMFMGGSCLVAGVKLFTKLLLADSYYSSWKFVPVLVIATVFSTLVSFLGSVYFLKKKSTRSMLTAMVGALVNVILNFVMIPRHGAMGAAVATLISYLAVFAVRSYDTSLDLKFKRHYGRLLFNTALLVLQVFVMIFEVPYWYFLEAGLLLLTLIFNGKALFLTAVRIFGRFFGKKLKKS